jgi:hypothetical protein
LNKLSKGASLGASDLPDGDHWVRFDVEEDSISYEVEASWPRSAVKTAEAVKRPSDFVRKLGGSIRKEESAGDAWLLHINEKHLR